MILFATSQYQYLRDAMAAHANIRVGHLDRKNFPDGESYHRLIEDVTEQDAVLVGGTVSDAETLEIYDLACGLVQAGAASLTILIPYFGYCTMDRAVKPGEVVKAKTRARLLSTLPQGTRGNRIALLDLHTEGLPHYFEGASHPVHLYAKRVVLEEIERLGQGDFVLACTDAGRAKWVESLANDLGVTASFVFKRRREDGDPEVMAASARVKGRRVVIYDDMIRSGQSLMNAARAYQSAGAASIAAVATHGLFPGQAFETIRASKLFEELVCTNSHPHAVTLEDNSEGFLKVRCVAPIFAEFLMQRFG